MFVVRYERINPAKVRFSMWKSVYKRIQLFCRDGMLSTRVHLDWNSENMDCQHLYYPLRVCFDLVK